MKKQIHLQLLFGWVKRSLSINFALLDLHEMLKVKGDWMPLGSADEQKPVEEGTVETWGRSPKNPVGGWYGIKKGLRGRFANYVPPIMEALKLAEVEHNPKKQPIASTNKSSQIPFYRFQSAANQFS